MIDQSFLKRVLVASVVAALFATSCGSAGSGTAAAGDSASGNSDAPDAASPQLNEGERTIVFAMDNGESWEFIGECKPEEVNDFGIENSFSISATHPDGHDLSIARSGFEADEPFELGSIEFAFSDNPDFNPFYATVADSFNATVNGDSLTATVDFDRMIGEVEPYGEIFTATLTC